MNIKTLAVLIYFTAAYDTIWWISVMSKLLRCFRCLTLYTLLNEMQGNYLYTDHLVASAIKIMHMNNGLPQRSVLVLIIFNLYISDFLQTKSCKFIYVDDITLDTQHNKFEVNGTTLPKDLKALSTYLYQWRLIPNTDKIILSLFQLNNHMENYESQILFRVNTLKYEPHPRYLGGTHDRKLSLKSHINNTSTKLKTRNNIIFITGRNKLGSLHFYIKKSSLALVYLVTKNAYSI